MASGAKERTNTDFEVIVMQLTLETITVDGDFSWIICRGRRENAGETLAHKKLMEEEKFLMIAEKKGLRI